MSTYFTICLLLCSIIVQTIAATTQAPIIEEDDYLSIIDSGLRDDFDWNLLKTFLGNDYKNVIVSPISLKIVLALLYEGAGGMTEQELRNVLNFNANKTIVRQEYAHIIESLLNLKKMGCEDSNQGNSVEEYTINLGTRVYLDSTIQPQQQFQSKACVSYQTKVESTNFTNAEKASANINAWVEKITEGRITRLVHENDVKNAVLLIANALYFKGTWRHQFPRNQTHKGGFYLLPNKITNVEYMANTDNYFFTDSKELDAKMIRIPYKGKKFSMIVLLPNAKAGLPRLIQNLNVQTLKIHINLMDRMSVDLILPKFKFDFQSRMASILKGMGLLSMFQNSASFPGITRGNSASLFVSDIVQKSGIEVNEEGSVAYAATDIVIGNKFGDAQISFNATHPFLFFIEDQQTHTILFVGKVEDPLEANAIPLPSRFGDLDLIKPIGSDDKIATVPLSTVTSQTPIFQLNPGSWNEPDDALAKRFNYFDLELLREVSRSNENVFISPASIKATLGMVLEGSKGLSAEEISKTLRLPANPNDARNQLKPLLYNPSDNNSPNSILESANAIFISNKLTVLDNYRKLIEQYYGGFVRSVNFSDVQSASNLINAWINNSTRGLIPRLVGPESLSPESSVVLTNALYFKGLWKKSFDEKSTNVKCFQLPSRQCQDSYMMQTTDFFNYRLIEEIDAHALEIPYSGDKYAMLVLLPRIKNNIQALTRDLQHASFGAIIDKLEPTEVLFELPKFDIEYTTDLVAPLRELGIHEVFGESADLSGIVPNERVSINNIVHKTKIEVNERGTIAAAVTAAIVIPLMGSSNPRVIADHPFAFFIYKKDNRNIIFEGIVNKPTQALPIASRSSFNYVQNTQPQQIQQPYQQQVQQPYQQQQQQQQPYQQQYQPAYQQPNYNNQRPLNARAASARFN